VAARSWGKGSGTKPVVGVAPLVPWGFAATVVVGKQGCLDAGFAEAVANLII